MRIQDYIRQVLFNIFFSLFSCILLSALLYFFNVSLDELFLLWICYICIIFIYHVYQYNRQHRHIRILISLFDTLDKKYLFTEIVPKPLSYLERTYFELVKRSAKQMNEEIANAKRLYEDYQEYLEQWVHELKVPITTIELICENNKTDISRKIAYQTELLQQIVELILFYARMENVEKDFIIKKIDLKECVFEVLSKNRQLLIQNDANVQTISLENAIVYSDEKWITFIINQIILNSIKYKKNDNLSIRISSKLDNNNIVLSISDNGIGIKESEISRVFDKGFVGSNGRTIKHSTGIGLYICKQLSQKIGIDIKIYSVVNEFTTVFLSFPINKENIVLQNCKIK